MKAVVFLGPKEMEVRDVPEPQCGPDEVVLKINACAVCGTDLRIYNFGDRKVTPPQIVGHEIAGTIEEIGSNVEGYEVGQRVTVSTPVGCGQCRFCDRGKHNLCQDFKALGYHFAGAFAQYMLLPAQSVKQGSIVPLPDNITFEQAALIEPLSCVANGQEYLNISEGDSVVVFGAGPIGCMHVELARAKGAEKIFLADIAQERLDLAQRFGADVYINSLEQDPVPLVIEATEGYGADVVICACSAPKVNLQALDLAAKGARLSYFAGLPKDKPTIEFDVNRMHYAEISLFGAFASNTPQYVEARDYMAAGKIDPDKFITATFPLEELVSNLEQSQRASGLKMVVLPQL